ncbi:magnesium-translocating P-type ATPase [Frateuria terrea]|uniref:Magnesium-transporting ATPase, P-type 1 n=1 Tax=Frateuria terrea TaxID=529704 RepID=A0A1H6UN10_9GAMM|nr:magnesium-translocating P-type ATPase [Frateuria terrea]SEI93743.1 Mg2+-importing ATPase [Frateuria terrea]SFP34550.1 Mg2+-importing ATPase [Frateuria terrea]
MDSPTSLADGPLPTSGGRAEASCAGLSEAEAARRRARYGANELRRGGSGILALVAAALANPLVAILIAAAATSGVLGDVLGAMIIAVIVLLSLVLNATLGFRSQRAAERLREEITPMATVCRDGRWQDRPRRELVPGDLIRLSAGDRIPADARLLDARDFHVQQAALTGESLPVEKEPASADARTGPEAKGRVFLGSSVVAGTAVAEVEATGAATAFGEVAARLDERPPLTEFERGLKDFAGLIMRTVVMLVLLVLLVGVVLHRPPLETLLFALALAVGLTPEFMPMITTVTLARGAVRMARRRVIVRHLAAIEDFGSMTVLLSDKTGTLTRGDTAVDGTWDASGRSSARTSQLAVLNAAFETGTRSPLDAAILRDCAASSEGWSKLDEIPLDFERRRMSVVVQRGGERWLIAKGAPESVLPACSQCESGDDMVPFDPPRRAECQRTYEAMGERGLRVLAIAWRPVETQARYTASDEAGMALAGFVSFVDPLMPGVAKAVHALASDGIPLKVLTGDNPRVARYTCEQAGLDPGRVVTGEELRGMSETALGLLAARTQVFALVTPEQKYRIVMALKARGEVVGFLGDGVNDAPSLHAADVGISVAHAADIARDSADILLREGNLEVLHAGVLEGRRAFANVMKYLFMGTSSNFGNMFSMVVGALVLPFLPMLPAQILLNNFLYDLAQTTIPSDNVDAAQLRGPQRWSVPLIRRFMVGIGPVSSLYDLLTFYVLIHWLHATAETFHTGWFIESLATQTLVVFVIRTHGNPLRSRPAVPLVASVVAVVAVGLALPWTPLAGVFGFVPLPPAFFAFLVIAACSYLLLVQVLKRRFMQVARPRRVKPRP